MLQIFWGTILRVDDGKNSQVLWKEFNLIIKELITRLDL